MKRNINKRTKNQAVNSQKNTQESMKAYLRGMHECIKASTKAELLSDGIFGEELEGHVNHFNYVADNALGIVTKLIDAQEITLSEENVFEWYDTCIRKMLVAYDCLSNSPCVFYDISLEGKTVKGVVFTTEEGGVDLVMGLAA